jgi:hypothetical protein
MDSILQHPYILKKCILTVCPIADIIRDEPNLISDGWEYFKNVWNVDYECMFMKQIGKKGLLNLVIWYHSLFDHITVDLLVEAARNNQLNILVWAKNICPDLFEPNVFSQAALYGSLDILKFFSDNILVIDNPYIIDYAVRGNQLQVLEWMYREFPENKGTYYLLHWICRVDCTFEVFQWVCDFLSPFFHKPSGWYLSLLSEQQEDKIKYLYQRRQIHLHDIPFSELIHHLSIKETPNTPLLEWIFREQVNIHKIYKLYPTIIWDELEKLIQKKHAHLIRIISHYMNEND